MVKLEPYTVLVADPPWKHKAQGGGRGASKEYPLLTVQEICDFELPPMAKRWVLFLWRVASMQQEALQVAKAWGATPKAELVWVKQTVQGNRHFGMGSYTRAEHETCLIASSSPPLTAEVRNVRSVITAPVPVSTDGKPVHSAKPEAFYKAVEAMYPSGRYVELFARRSRRGWTCRGNELTPVRKAG